MRTENLQSQHPFRDSTESLQREAENDALRRRLAAQEAAEQSRRNLTDWQLIVRANTEERERLRREFCERMEAWVLRNPWYVPCPANGALMEREIIGCLSQTGRTEFDATDVDLDRVAYMFGPEGENKLLIRREFPYRRRSPNTQELAELSQEQLRELAHGRNPFE